MAVPNPTREFDTRRVADNLGLLPPIPVASTAGLDTPDEEPQYPQDQRRDQHEPKDMSGESESAKQGQYQQQYKQSKHRIPSSSIRFHLLDHGGYPPVRALNL